MTTQRTAIVILAFNRPEHVKRLMATLERNPEFFDLPVLAFVDGPRDDNDSHLVGEVAEILRQARAEGQVTQRSSNLGVAASVTSAVTAALSVHDRVIVLEDDLEVSPHFLKYMIDGLDFYEQDPRVASIHGYTIRTRDVPTPTYFLRGSDCWGWATWRRSWANYRHDAGQMAVELRERGLEKGFTFSGRSNHLELLRMADHGEVDSWAIRWHAATYLAGGLTLYPSKTLVRNGGMDGSGRHSGNTDIYDSDFSRRPVRVGEGPVKECAEAFGEYKKFYSRRARSKMLLKARARLDRTIRLRTLGSLWNRTTT